MDQNATLLLEYNRETIKQQFSKFLEKNKNEIIEHFGSIDGFLETLEESDPKGGSENVVTILVWIKNGLLSFPEVKNGIDIQYHDRTIHLSISDIFKYYTKVKNKKLLPKKYYDIRFITDWLRFIEFLIELVNLMSNIEQQEEANKKGEGKLIFTGKNKTRFYESYDKDHACYIGKGTLWCTAATKSRNYFDEFMADGFRVITVIPANPKHDGREKYQFNLYSWAEGGFGETRIFPPIIIFNFLNKAVPPEELSKEIYTDLIDFLFKELYEELKIKRDVQYSSIIKNNVDYTELLDYFYSDITYTLTSDVKKILELHRKKGYFSSFNDITKKSLHEVFRNQTTIEIVEKLETMVAIIEIFAILEDLHYEYKDSTDIDVAVNQSMAHGKPKELMKYAIKINSPILLLNIIYTCIDDEIEENDTITIKL